MANWTVLFYMNADHEDYYEQGLANKILNELNDIGSNENLNIMVLLDRYKPSGASTSNKYDPCIYRVEYNKKITFNATPLKILPHKPLGDPSILKEFIEFCDADPKYAADNYALVIWDHGGGFFTEGHEYKGIFQINTPFLKRLNSSGERRDVSRQMLYAPFSMARRYTEIGLKILNTTDENEDGYLYPSEIAAVINDTIINKLQIIVFDACWMASFETAYSLKDVTSYVVASENTLSNDGLDYRSLALLKRPRPISAEELCTLIVNNTLAYKLKGELFATTSAYRTNAVGPLTALLNDFCEKIMANKDMYELIYLARASCMNFYYDPDPRFGLDSIDLLYFFETFKARCKDMEEEPVQIERLTDEIIHMIKNKLIIAAKGGDEIIKKGEVIRYWGACGISIYFPDDPFTFGFFVNLPDWYFDPVKGRQPFNSEKWKQLLIHYFKWMEDKYGVFIKPPEKNSLL